MLRWPFLPPSPCHGGDSSRMSSTTSTTGMTQGTSTHTIALASSLFPSHLQFDCSQRANTIRNVGGWAPHGSLPNLLCVHIVCSLFTSITISCLDRTHWLSLYAEKLPFQSSIFPLQTGTGEQRTQMRSNFDIGKCPSRPAVHLWVVVFPVFGRGLDWSVICGSMELEFSGCCILGISQARIRSWQVAVSQPGCQVPMKNAFVVELISSSCQTYNQVSH